MKCRKKNVIECEYEIKARGNIALKTVLDKACKLTSSAYDLYSRLCKEDYTQTNIHDVMFKVMNIEHELDEIKILEEKICSKFNGYWFTGTDLNSYHALFVNIERTCNYLKECRKIAGEMYCKQQFTNNGVAKQLDIIADHTKAINEIISSLKVGESHDK